MILVRVVTCVTVQSSGEETWSQVILRDESACLPVDRVNCTDSHLSMNGNHQYLLLPSLSTGRRPHKFSVAATHRNYLKPESAKETEDFA